MKTRADYNATLEDQIRVDIEEAKRGINELKSSLSGLKASVDSIGKSNGLTNFNKQIKQTTGIGKNFKSILGFGTVVAGARKAWSLLKEMTNESIDFVETTNLFNVSMGKGLNGLNQYYEKAVKFQNDLQEKLGINIAESMEYQALFNSMSKSMGISAKYAYTLSENFTKLGYDLASLYNINPENAMQKLRAGLAGQTKPLRDLGLDITQQSLQPIVDSLGIDRSIKNMSQAEKMILRYIAVLNQAKIAQGDFANTTGENEEGKITSLANQIRIFNAQVVAFKRNMGNLWQGFLGGILPYVNAIMMVINELLKMVAKLFGFKVSEQKVNISANVGADDLASDLGTAGKKAKELKAQLMGFDEINNISLQDNSGSGGSSGGATGIDQRLLDAMEEYNNLMDKVSNKATEIRDKILDWLGVTDGSYKNLKKIGAILATVAGIIVGIKILSTIGNIIKWFKLLGEVFAGTTIAGTGFQTAIATIGSILSGISAPILAVIAALTLLAGGMVYVYATNEQVRNSVAEVCNAFRENLQPLFQFFSETVIPDLQNAWNRLLEILSPLGEFIKGVFTSCWNDFIIPALKWLAETVLPMVIDTFKNLWNNILKPLAEFIGNVLEPVVKTISDVLTILWKNVVVPLAQAIGELLAKAFEGICEILNNVVIPVVGGVIDILNWLWQNVLSPIINFLWDTFKPVFENVFGAIKSIIDGLKQTFGGLIDFITGVFSGNWSKAWEGVKNIFKGVWTSLSGIVSKVWDTILHLFTKGGQIFSGVVEGIANVFKSIVNTLIRGINKVIAVPFNAINGLLNNIRNTGIFDLKPFAFIPYNALPVPRIPTFSTGGFPEDGLFMANRRELVGKFSNGKTAVANNEQIIDGIKQGVYEAVMEAMSQQKGGMSRVEIVADKQGIFKVVQTGAEEYAMQTGENPFPVMA